MRKVSILMMLAILAVGCGKKSTPSPPSAAALIFPDNNAACITGTPVAGTANIGVPFSWHAGANATSYIVMVKNLLTGEITTKNSNAPGLTIDLVRATPYSWYVISKSSTVSGTAQSDTWKFYNSGPGVESYAPFPADLLTPTFAQVLDATAGQVTLTWNCSDIDNDLVGYDVYFGTTTTPPLLQSNVTTKSFAATVTSGTVYYWQIVAKDAKGNTSASDVFQFKVN